MQKLMTIHSLMQMIDKVKHISVESSLTAIMHLVNTRLLPELLSGDANDAVALGRLETAAVTFTLFVTEPIEHGEQDGPVSLGAFFESIHQLRSRAFSVKATHAIQTLVWKRAGLQTTESASDWWKILRHPLLESAGHLNKGRIGRRVV